MLISSSYLFNLLYCGLLQVNVGYGAAKGARPSDLEDGLSGAVRPFHLTSFQDRQWHMPVV